MDQIPILSQCKSLFQFACGDSEGARKTQENFLNKAPIISQCKSAVQAVLGDNEGALETQKEFLNGMDELADGLPIVGHAKGAIHLIAGDKEKGFQALKAASRSVGVIGGALVGGPAGAISGGIAMDALITGADSLVNNTYKPSGIVQFGTNMLNQDTNAGEIFDNIAGIFLDGVGGKGVKKSIRKTNERHIYRVTNSVDVKKAVQEQRIPKSHSLNRQKGEVWFSESVKHSKQFLKQRRNQTPNIPQSTMRVTFDKKNLQKVKQECIEQRNSRNINQDILRKQKNGEKVNLKNIVNDEKLEQYKLKKKNIGIKGEDNLNLLNEQVKKIKEIPPKSKNGIQKFIGRHYQNAALIVAQTHHLLCRACGCDRTDNFRYQDDKTLTYICRDCQTKWKVDKRESEPTLKKTKTSDNKNEDQINKKTKIQIQIECKKQTKDNQNMKISDNSGINLQSQKLHLCSKCGCSRQDNYRHQKENIQTFICRNSDCKHKWKINQKI
ncbi:hypothetical protein ABPG74_020569 [Tetrahymena malaccensis]